MMIDHEPKVGKSREQVAPEHVNCRCVPPNMTVRPFIEAALAAGEILYKPSRILKSGTATIVFWKDGTKTVVKCAPETTPNDYDAFTAALAIKIFDNNSKLKKLIRNLTVEQKPVKKKVAEPESSEAGEACEADRA